MTETITNAASLDALPEGATVLDGDFDIMTKGADGEWHQRAEQDEPSPCHLPATLLYRPDQPTAVKPSVEAVADLIFETVAEHEEQSLYAWSDARVMRTAAVRVLALLPDPAPTVTPSAEDIIEAMVSAAPEVYAEQGVMWHESKAEDIRASAGPYARAVLALLPGRTVDEVWRAAWESCCLRSGVGRDEALADYLAGGE